MLLTRLGLGLLPLFSMLLLLLLLRPHLTRERRRLLILARLPLLGQQSVRGLGGRRRLVCHQRGERHGGAAQVRRPPAAVKCAGDGNQTARVLRVEGGALLVLAGW